MNLDWQETLGAWRRLIERYAGDRKVCNCGDAYYSIAADGHTFCAGGCQANAYGVKAEIAARVLREIK